jgi:AAA domain
MGAGGEFSPRLRKGCIVSKFTDEELAGIAEDFSQNGSDPLHGVPDNELPDDEAFLQAMLKRPGYNEEFLRKRFAHVVEKKLREEHIRAASGNSRAVPGDEFILNAPLGTPAIWGEGSQVLWAEGEGTLIAAHQGLGKTTISQQLILRALGIGGTTFLGLPVRQVKGRVLYLAMDRPAQAARSWRRMVSEGDAAVLHDRLVVWKGPLPINVLASPNALADWAQGFCADMSMLVADSVKDFCPGISKDDVGAGLNLAWQEIVARQVELLLLHHQRKAQGGQAERLNTLVPTIS